MNLDFIWKIFGFFGNNLYGFSYFFIVFYGVLNSPSAESRLKRL